jgi:hypothetical protein
MKIKRLSTILLLICITNLVLSVKNAVETNTATKAFRTLQIQDSLRAALDARKQDSIQSELRILLDLVCLNPNLREPWRTRLACQDSAAS